MCVCIYTNLFIIGDWNAKVGSQETPGVTGKHTGKKKNHTNDCGYTNTGKKLTIQMTEYCNLRKMILIFFFFFFGRLQKSDLLSIYNGIHVHTDTGNGLKGFINSPGFQKFLFFLLTTFPSFSPMDLCSLTKTKQKKNNNRNFFPGGPVVKNPPSNAGDVGSMPGPGSKIPHATEQPSPYTTTKTRHSQVKKNH